MYKYRHMLRFNVPNTLYWVVQKFVDTLHRMKVIITYAILARVLFFRALKFIMMLRSLYNITMRLYGRRHHPLATRKKFLDDPTLNYNTYATTRRATRASIEGKYHVLRSR